jgi:hypothetical protein
VKLFHHPAPRQAVPDVAVLSNALSLAGDIAGELKCIQNIADYRAHPLLPGDSLLRLKCPAKDTLHAAHKLPGDLRRLWRASSDGRTSANAVATVLAHSEKLQTLTGRLAGIFDDSLLHGPRLRRAHAGARALHGLLREELVAASSSSPLPSLASPPHSSSGPDAQMIGPGVRVATRSSRGGRDAIEADADNRTSPSASVPPCYAASEFAVPLRSIAALLEVLRYPAYALGPAARQTHERSVYSAKLLQSRIEQLPAKVEPGDGAILQEIDAAVRTTTDLHSHIIRLRDHLPSLHYAAVFHSLDAALRRIGSGAPS